MDNDKCRCGKPWPPKSDPECGVRVCPNCHSHKGLARCFCGWAADGGDGRRQLEEMGETIDEDNQ